MAFPQGINFRNTSGFVTDGANESFEGNGSGGLTLPSYPRTTAQGNTVGWETPNGVTIDERDRNSANDRRIAGHHFNLSNTTTKFTYRVDLTAGDYGIQCAHGDANYSSPVQMEILDTNSSLGTYVSGSTGASQSFKDIYNVVRSNSTAPPNLDNNR